VFFFYAEHYNNAVRKISSAGLFKILPGGISTVDHENLAAISETYFTDPDRQKRFLNWCPATKTTALGIPEKLYFLTGVSEPVVHIKLKATRELLSETTTVGSITSNGTVYEFLCGLHELIPDAVEGEVLEYDIWLEDENDKIISEVRTFIVDATPYAHSRVFLWRNSFGAYETLRCTGEQSISDNIERSEIVVMQNNHYRIRLHDVENLPEHELHTGWLDGVEQRRWLNDFLMSRELYLIEGNALKRVRITTSKLLREVDNEFSYAAMFAYTPDMPEKLYSEVEI
jgi:hypothetical protein